MQYAKGEYSFFRGHPYAIGAAGVSAAHKKVGL
jgi:hypothetical protein